jgi:hypothetical protein
MDASRQSKKDDIWLFSSFKTFLRKYNEIALLASKTMKIDVPIDIYDIDKLLSAFDTTTVQQRIFFYEVYTNLSICWMPTGISLALNPSLVSTTL